MTDPIPNPKSRPDASNSDAEVGELQLASAPNARRFEVMPPERRAVWDNYCVWPERMLFPKMLGFQLEDVRLDYARIRMPYRPEHNQTAGVIHGGAIAALIDTVVVPALGSPYDEIPVMLTLSMTVNYTGVIAHEDAVAEGWTTRRGKSIVFCEASVRTDAGELVATGSMVYKVQA